MIILAITQLIMHYLGWIGIVLGIIAIIFSNLERGVELLFGGIVLIVLKYIIGFLFLGIQSLVHKDNEQES